MPSQPQKFLTLVRARRLIWSQKYNLKSWVLLASPALDCRWDELTCKTNINCQHRGCHGWYVFNLGPHLSPFFSHFWLAKSEEWVPCMAQSQWTPQSKNDTVWLGFLSPIQKDHVIICSFSLKTIFQSWPRTAPIGELKESLVVEEHIHLPIRIWIQWWHWAHGPLEVFSLRNMILYSYTYLGLTVYIFIIFNIHHLLEVIFIHGSNFCNLI